MSQSFTIQVRSVLGALTFFSTAAEFLRFFENNRGSIVKVSFDDSVGESHRFTMRYGDGVFARALLDNCGKVFPIDTLLFVDVPLCLTTAINRKINRFCDLLETDFHEAHDCVCVKNAFTEEGFFEYLREVESLFVNRELQYPCDCDCCTIVPCSFCEPQELADFHHITPCGNVCFCYECVC
jgi:hypothetical protein